MIKNIVEQNATELLKKKNVNGVAVGEKWVNGKPTGQQAIVVMVEEKQSISTLAKADIIPKTIKGIQTDVMGRVGKIVALRGSFKNKERPLTAGTSCGHLWISAGTLGGFFYNAKDQLIALSNNHVLAAENRGVRRGDRGRPGHVMLQPGKYDRGRHPSSSVGNLLDYVKINRRNNLEDSAIALIKPGVPINKAIKVIGEIKGFNEKLKIGEKVHKSGRTTGYTIGRVTGLNAIVNVHYDTGIMEFKDQILFSNMSAGGDSGSVICDMNGNASALLFAGSNTVTIGNNIKYPRRTYGLKLQKGTPQPEPSQEEVHTPTLKQTLLITVTENGKTISHEYDTIAEIEDAIIFAQNQAKKNGSSVDIKLAFNATFK